MGMRYIQEMHYVSVLKINYLINKWNIKNSLKTT